MTLQLNDSGSGGPSDPDIQRRTAIHPHIHTYCHLRLNHYPNLVQSVVLDFGKIWRQIGDKAIMKGKQI